MTKKKTKKKTKKIKEKEEYKLIIQIGKKAIKGRVFKFKTDNPVESLLGLNIPNHKIMEAVTFTLEKDGMRAVRGVMPFKARGIFKNKLNAFYLIKTMKWIMKPI